MTTESYSEDSVRKISMIIELLNQIINALDGFRKDYTKKFNFSKLMDFLNLPKSEIDDIIYLILNYQEKFNSVFKNYLIKKKVIDGKIYLIAEEKSKLHLIPKKPSYSVPTTIKIKKYHAHILSDIIYVFKYIKRGKGFTANSNCNDLINSLKDLKKIHPYFFEIYENGLIYPSKLGIKLGELVLSYNKSNKEFTSIKIDNYKIMVISDK